MASTAKRDIELGSKYPYDSIHESDPFIPGGWQYTAARAVINNLRGRKGIGNELDQIDMGIREEIVGALAEIIYTVAGEDGIQPNYGAVSDLLAVLHGDGGHYEAKHGREKAARDALEIVHGYRQKLAENDLL